MRQQVFQYYQKKAQPEEQTSEKFQQVILQKFLNKVSLVPSFFSWRVLDFGTGLGNNLHTLQKYFDKIESAEINPKRVKLLKKEFPKISHHLLKRNKLPFDKNSFDLIIATEVLEHIPSYAQTIERLFSILKPKGYLIISTPNYFNLAGVVKWLNDRKSKKKNWNPWGVHHAGWEEPVTFLKLIKVFKGKFKIIKFSGADLYLAWFFFLPKIFRRFRRYLLFPPFYMPILGKISMHNFILAQKK